MTGLHYLEKREYQPNIQFLVLEKHLVKYGKLVFELIELKKTASTSNDIIRKYSLDTYDELIELIRAKEYTIPERVSCDEDIREMISYLRLMTLNHYKQARYDKPFLFS